ncbi:hypothetical protein [Streptomyces qinglanensis]|uniref:hypothetical protein n=1 Tax=Streptomyces qinglanensis TaxID=943816 RepID=UPI003D75B205
MTNFAYLSPETGALRVSVDLDSAASQLVRPDCTVPLRVDVQDTVVLDASRPGAADREEASG